MSQIFEMIQGFMVGYSFITSLWMVWHMFKLHSNKSGETNRKK